MATQAGLADTLRNKNLFALWIGQLISQIGDQFATIAVLLLVNNLTASTLPLAILALSLTIPQIIFGLLGGVFVDRWDRKTVMIVSDVVRGLAISAVLLIHRADQLYILYLAIFIMSTMGAFFYPARNAVIPNIVPERMLLPANTLVQSSQLLALLFGISAAGLAVGWLGTSFAFAFDAVTFGVSAIAILTMSIPPLTNRSTQTSVRTIWNQLLEGLRYIKDSSLLTNVLLITSVATLGFGSMLILGLKYLDLELGVSAQRLSFLYLFLALGMVIGGAVLNHLTSRVRINVTVGMCIVSLGLAIIVFALAPNYPLVLAAAVIIGVTIVAARSVLITITQTLVPDEKCGRVQSAVNMVINASTSAAMALSGVLGDLIGVQVTFVTAGVITLFSGVAAISVLQGVTTAMRTHEEPVESS
ncbi:MAG: MFS transporter [Anaerolineae bacterium]|jgi:MFS family permease|nr:MFS transporter [Anaerolineae bacterium]MDH7472950.1 MFS transporter [Anaerolineae bacterium]